MTLPEKVPEKIDPNISATPGFSHKKDTIQWQMLKNRFIRKIP